MVGWNKCIDSNCLTISGLTPDQNANPSDYLLASMHYMSGIWCEPVTDVEKHTKPMALISIDQNKCAQRGKAGWILNKYN